eukprot:980602-Alexandrium_andersonii.AAC.1
MADAAHRRCDARRSRSHACSRLQALASSCMPLAWPSATLDSSACHKVQGLRCNAPPFGTLPRA